MPRITANSLELEYDTHGDPANPPMLLVMGLGAQMTLWPIELVEALVERGFHVIRYDNRDIGLSQKFDGERVPGIAWHIIRKRFGHRLHSLTSIFSTTGNSKLPQADREAIKALTMRPPSMEEHALIEHGMMVSTAIGSPGYRPDPERQRQRVAENIRRSVYPEGMLRQMAAIIDDGDRTERLKAVTAPTLVLHGEDDPLVKVEGGRATAAAIPGAKLKTFPGWGHDLPMELVDPIAEAIAEHARSAG